MVNSRRANVCFLGMLLLALVWHATTAAPVKKMLADKPTLAAASMELDGPTHVLVLTEVSISTQSGYVIKAGQARTADANNFNNSSWTFTHKVEITTPDGSSNADTATVSFMDNQISLLHLAGSPATFEQHDAAKKIIAQGHADAIDYDLAQNTVRLKDNVWVSYGQYECRAVAMVYNIIQQKFVFPSKEQQGERVNCTISPAAGTESKANSP